MELQAIRDVVVTLSGVVGLISILINIYYNSTSNRILLKRFRGEEEAKQVAGRADDLMRRAHEIALSEGGGSVMRMVPLELTDEIDKKAAWKLCKEGHARMQGNRITIDVDLLPNMIARDMARRAAMRAPDNFH